jgi:branched-chain amino acid transport system substrate-binding protein
MRGWLTLSTASVLAVLLANASAADELKLGALATLSGPGAAWGMAILSAAELAAAEVNAKGGLAIGDKHDKVTVVSYDDKYKPTDAVTGINRFIYEDGVHFVVGPLGSAPLAAILPITTENKVLTMTMAWSSVAMKEEYPYSFRPLLTSREVALPQLKWILSKVAVKHVVIVGPNNESGQATSGDARDAYKRLGVPDVGLEMYEADRADFSPLLTKLIAGNIDAIDLDGSAPVTAGLIVKQARELGFKGAIIRTGGEGTADILKVAGANAAEGLYVHQPINPDDPKIKDYVARYAAAYKGDMNAYSPVLYANVQVLFAAMEKAGTVTDVDKIAETMAGMHDFETVLGKVNWTKGSDYEMKHQFLTPFYVGQISGGRLKIVASCNFDGCK